MYKNCERFYMNRKVQWKGENEKNHTYPLFIHIILIEKHIHVNDIIIR